MQRLSIYIPRRRHWTSSDRVELFGDGGSGTIDTSTPLVDGSQRVWRDSAVPAGHMLDGHLMMGHLDDVRPEGHLCGLHLLGEHGWCCQSVWFETPPYYFGAFAHRARVVDGAGNVCDTPAVGDVCVINSWPQAVRSASVIDYDSAAEQVTIAFEPSVSLADGS